MDTELSLSGRDFLREVDFSCDELHHLVDLAVDLKHAKRTGTETRRLTGRSIALIFEKTSTRTRIAGEVAAFDQGAHVTFIDPSASQLGHKESVADTARVLSRVYDALLYRGSAQETVDQLAAYASIPVYNGLTDLWHPTQMLADVMTMQEHVGRSISDISYAYIGDARFNMGNSLLVTGAILGADVRIIAPRELWPDEEVRRIAAHHAAISGARVTLTDDPAEGLVGADVVHTDVWVSMGESAQVWAERISLLRPYRVDAALMRLTGRASHFMHCLPAYHDTSTGIGREVAERFGLTDGIEVTDEVFESPASIVFDQAENRLHTIKAIYVATLSG